MEARDFLLVNQYTSANVLGVVEQTELLDMLRHFEELPDQQIVENPWLGVPYSLVEAFVNPSEDVEHILQKSEQGLVNLENTSLKQRLISLLDGIRAYLAYLKGEPDRVLRFVHRAMDNLPQDEQTILAQFLNLEGLAYQLQLKPPDGIRSYEAALLAGQSMAGLFQAMVNCGLVSAQFSIEASAPVPIDTSATTAPTPMTMPNMVSAERSLFAMSARKALRTFCARLSLIPPPRP